VITDSNDDAGPGSLTSESDTVLVAPGTVTGGSPAYDGELDHRNSTYRRIQVRTADSTFKLKAWPESGSNLKVKFEFRPFRPVAAPKTTQGCNCAVFRVSVKSYSTH
jgi:hypothetical protein